MNRYLILLLLLTAGPVTAGDYFRCNGPDGVVMSDIPCSNRVEKRELPEANSSGHHGSHYRPAPKPAERVAEPDPYPHIMSHRLRNLRVREQITKGMTRDQVRDSWGDPSSVTTSSNSRDQWTYRWASGAVNYVYFDNGCVQSWQSHEP